jgi:DNA-binding transcriptional ArsR family regulator
MALPSGSRNGKPRCPRREERDRRRVRPGHFRIFAIAKTWYAGSVDEQVYRQSRLCRVLGNPLAFSVVQLLAEQGEMRPSQIAEAVGRSVSRVSHVLAALRLAEVVRYEPDRRTVRYRLKQPRETRQLLATLGRFIEAASVARR